MTIPEISPADASQRIDKGEAVLVDVREVDEWQSGHAPQATHMPLSQLDVSAWPDAPMLIMVCRSGARSSKAAATFATAGRSVLNLTGGMRAWEQAGLDVRTDAGEPGTVA